MKYKGNNFRMRLLQYVYTIIDCDIVYPSQSRIGDLEKDVSKKNCHILNFVKLCYIPKHGFVV